MRASAWYSLRECSRHVDIKIKDISLKRICTVGQVIPVDVFRPVTGLKITKYRALYSQRINELPENSRGQTVEWLVRELTADDSLGWGKMAERKSGIPISDYAGEGDLYDEVVRANGVLPWSEYRKERMRLWMARIERFLKQSSKHINNRDTLKETRA